jgi:hypothetical protein
VPDQGGAESGASPPVGEVWARGRRGDPRGRRLRRGVPLRPAAVQLFRSNPISLGRAGTYASIRP